MTSELHIGKLLKAYIDKKRASRAELGRVIGKDASTINYYLRRSSLPTVTILQISHAMKHNFFADIAAKLPATYTTSAGVDVNKDERIAALEEEIAQLKIENRVLEDTIGRIVGGLR